MIYIGIDPGVHGGIAVIAPGEVLARPMPKTDRELIAFLRTYRPVVDRMPGGFRPIAFALLERVWGMPGWGARNFTFGASYGGLRMALAGMRIQFEETLPQRWQKAMGVVYPKRSDGGRRDKNITKQRAEALFPQLTITHAIADALLIAEFCRRLHRSGDGEEKGRGSRQVGAGGREGAREKGGTESRRQAESARAAVGSAAGDGKDPQSATRQPLRSDRGRSALDGERARR